MNNKIEIINLHHHNKNLPVDAFPIHRPYPLGNPYKKDDSSTKNERIEAYRGWLKSGVKAKDGRYHDLLRLMLTYQHLEGLKLACWCAPHACHGEVIRDAILWLEEQKLENGVPYYCGIGPRKISPELQEKIKACSEMLDMKLYSGGAPGADQAWASGAKAPRIFLPWKSFEEGNHPLNAEISFEPNRRAYFLSQLYHPNPNALSRGAATLTARNAHIIFGENLSSFPKFILYAAPGGTEPQGGTGNALRLARAHGIDTFMVHEETDLDEFIKDLIA